MGRIEIFEAHQNILVTFQICPRANYLGCYWCRFKRYTILHCIVLQDHGKINLFRLKKFLLFFCFIYPLFFFIYFFFFCSKSKKNLFHSLSKQKVQTLLKLTWLHRKSVDRLLLFSRINISCHTTGYNI